MYISKICKENNIKVSLELGSSDPMVFDNNLAPEIIAKIII
jgi:hypothetical protein